MKKTDKIRNSCRAGCENGFTLIEVMLAVSILGVGLAMLLTGASRCLAAIRQAIYYQDVEWVLSMGEAEYPLVVTNKIEEMEVESETFDNGFTYSRTVQDDDDEDGLYVVTTTVSGPGGARHPMEKICRYVFIPPDKNKEKQR